MRAGHRAHAVGARDRAVAGVLVVIEEDADALLLPPFRRRLAGHPPLHLARQRERGAAHLGEVPAAFRAHVDVDAARAARLREAAHPVLVEHVAHRHRDLAHGLPADALRRVEVDAQLVRMVEVVAAHRPRVPVDVVEVRRPDEVRGVDGHELRRASPGREMHGRRLQPRRRVLDALVEEEVAGDALVPALEHGRALTQAEQHRVGDRHVVLDQFELRDRRPPVVRGEHLLGGARHADVDPGGFDRRLILCHPLAGWRTVPRSAASPTATELIDERPVLVAPDSFKGTLRAARSRPRSAAGSSAPAAFPRT